MSVPKIGVSMLVIAFTVLFAAAFGHTSNESRDIVATQMSVNETYGYLPGENLNFLINQAGTSRRAPPPMVRSAGKG